MGYGIEFYLSSLCQIATCHLSRSNNVAIPAQGIIINNIFRIGPTKMEHHVFGAVGETLIVQLQLTGC
jgi:hypothetical protein